MWIKWTFPRLRIDQILNLEWKYLMPLALLNLVLMTVCVSFDLTGIVYVGYAVAAVIAILLAVIVVRAIKFKSRYNNDQELVGVSTAIKKD